MHPTDAGDHDGARLSEQHWQLLKASAISDAVAAARGYQTISNLRTLPPQFTGKQRDLHGLLIPFRDATGRIATYQLRPDDPRRDAHGKVIKYETAAKGRLCLDVPDAVRPYLLDSSERLWITEGARKVDSGLSHGIRAIIALLGVWNFRGTHPNGAKALLPDWDFIALNGREVVIAYDSDVMRKVSVRSAIDRLAGIIKLKGGTPRYAFLPDLPSGEKQGLDDFFAAGHTLEELTALIVDDLPEPIPDWPEPIQLDVPHRPPFPTDALPPTVRALVEAVAEETQTPSDLPAVVALGTLSTAVGGQFRIIVEGNWSEPVHGQLLSVLESANRKSSVFRTVTEPIRAYERQRAAEERKALARWQAERRVKEAMLKKLEQKAAEPDKRGNLKTADLDRQIAALAQELVTDRSPRITQLIADDATHEKLAQLLAEQRGALAVMSAEGGFFANIGGRYDKQPNLDTVLKGHAGDEIRVDRVGRGAEYIPRPALTICIATQPETVKELGNISGFTGKGAAARLWASFPTSTVGFRKLRAKSIPEPVQAQWATVITDLLERVTDVELDADGYTVPHTITLSEDAYALHLEFRAWIEPNLRDDGAFATMKAWGGKLAGAAARIAGLLHLAAHAQHPAPHTLPVSNATMAQAIAIAEYFAAHAAILYEAIGERDDLEAAREVLDVITQLGPQTSKREVHQHLRGRLRFRKVAALDAPLRTLEEPDLIRVRRERRNGSIRPSDVIEFNPLLNRLNNLNNEPNDPPSAPIEAFEAIEEAEMPGLDEMARFSSEVREEVEAIAAELRAGGPEAMAAWRREVENNADLPDEDRDAALLALHLAQSRDAA